MAFKGDNHTHPKWEMGQQMLYTRKLLGLSMNKDSIVDESLFGL
jgi:hypothetical protein